jgi:hypothetical protein
MGEVFRKRLLEAVASWRRAAELADESSKAAYNKDQWEMANIYDNRAGVFRYCADELERVLSE